MPSTINSYDSVVSGSSGQKIREKYAALQVQIDAAQTTEELKSLMP